MIPMGFPYEYSVRNGLLIWLTGGLIASSIRNPKSQSRRRIDMQQEQSANCTKNTPQFVYPETSARRIGFGGLLGAWSLAMMVCALFCGCEKPIRHYFVAKTETSSKLKGIEVVDPNHLFLGAVQISIDKNFPTKLYVHTVFDLTHDKPGDLSSITILCIKENSNIFDVQIKFDEGSIHQSDFFEFPIDFPPEWLENACLIVRPNATTRNNLQELKIELRRKEYRVNRSVV